MKYGLLAVAALVACGGRIAPGSEATSSGGSSGVLSSSSSSSSSGASGSTSSSSGGSSGASSSGSSGATETAFTASEVANAQKRCGEPWAPEDLATEADVEGAWLVCRTGDGVLLRGDKTMLVYSGGAVLTPSGGGKWSFETTGALPVLLVSRDDGRVEAYGQPYLSGRVLGVYEAQSREPRLLSRLR